MTPELFACWIATAMLGITDPDELLDACIGTDTTKTLQLTEEDLIDPRCRVRIEIDDGREAETSCAVVTLIAR